MLVIKFLKIMTAKEHEQYIKDLKNLTGKLLSSKTKSAEFYQSAGIHTKSGKLANAYKESNRIGFKVSKDNR